MHDTDERDDHERAATNPAHGDAARGAAHATNGVVPDGIVPLPGATREAASPAAANSPLAATAARPIPAETRLLCGELARQARDFYPERDWGEVEPILQRIWLREPRGIAWPLASALIHAAWRPR